MRKIENSAVIPIFIVVIGGAISIFGFLKGFLNLHISLLYTLLVFIVAILLHIVFKLTRYDSRLSDLDRKLFVHDNFAMIALDFAQNLTSEYIDNPNLDNKELVKGIITNLQEASNKATKTLLSPQPWYSLSPKRLHELLDKYKNETINEEEAYELEKLLEEEKAKKEREGDIAGAIFVGILLLAILAFIAHLLSQQR